MGALWKELQWVLVLCGRSSTCHGSAASHAKGNWHHKAFGVNPLWEEPAQSLGPCRCPLLRAALCRECVWGAGEGMSLAPVPSTCVSPSLPGQDSAAPGTCRSHPCHMYVTLWGQLSPAGSTKNSIGEQLYVPGCQVPPQLVCRLVPGKPTGARAAAFKQCCSPHTLNI